MYKVEYSKRALRDLKKMDAHISSLLISWIRKNLEGCSDPRHMGKALKGPQSGAWRYRIGEYRIIAEIMDDELLILTLAVGHRRDIYSRL